MTIELVVGVVGLIASLLTAGRLIFGLEADVRAHARLSDETRGAMKALEAIASEGKAAHERLTERVSGIAAIVAEKASVESVDGLREAVDTLRRDLGATLVRIENKIDENARHSRDK